VETIVVTGGLDLAGESMPGPPAPTEPPALPGLFHLYLPLVPARWQPNLVAQRSIAGVAAVTRPQGRPGDAIVREKGAFQASFDEQGLRYTPKTRLVEEDDYHVDFHLSQVRSGKTKLFQPGSPQRPPVSPPGQPDLVRYERGEYFGEEYLVTEGGVEQRFVFPQPFALDGDLEIEGNLEGNLQPAFRAETGEVQFLTPAGETVVSYGRAIVEEACGERMVAAMELTGRRLRIIIPQAWLQTACFPLVVDPLIGPNFAVSTQPIAGNQERASVADDGAGRYLVAWHGAGNGSDVFAQVVSSEGMLVSGTIPLGTRTYDQQYPDAAGNTRDQEYLVAWQGTTGLPTNWDIYARRVYSDGRTAGSRITVYAGTYDQQYPAVAYNPNDDQYMVVWQSYDTSSRTYGIYGQVLGSDGTPVGGRVTLYTSSAQLSYPDVTCNVSDTHYLVAWQQYAVASRWDIRGKIVDADGDPVTADFDVTAESNDQAVPAAAYDVSAGNYLVAWQSYVDVNNLDDVQGRRVDRSGNLLGSRIGIATGSDDQRAPDLAWGAARGEWLVVWERQAPEVTNWDVYARRVSGGGPVGDAIAVYGGLLDQRYPAVAYDGQTGEYLPAWQDYRSGSDWDVYGQRVDADGTLEGEEVLVSAEPAEDAQDQAAVAYGSGAETYLVVWTDDRSGNGDVYGQLVASGGALVGASFTIGGETGYVEQYPAVAYDAVDDVYLVVWERRLPPMQDDDWNLYAQRVAGDGDLVGSALAICTAAGDQDAPAVAYDAGTGYFLVAWEDNRNGNWDVYARAVQGSDGSMADEFAVYTGDYDQRYPDVAANEADGVGAQGAAPYLVAWQDGRNRGDVYGRRAEVGQPAGAAFAIAATADPQQYPAVAVGAQRAAPYLVVWQHGNGSDDDVRGRRVGAEGNLLGSEITVTSGSAEQTCPDVAANGAGGGWTVAWQQGATNSDLHARHVDGTGLLLGGEEEVSAASSSQEQPALAYDTNRGRYLAVWADYRHQAEGPDVYGQLVRDYTVVIDYRYDPLQRLVRADYSTGVGFGYAFDAVGNRLRMTETTPLSGTVVTTYDYDPADRLTAVTRGGVETPYSWSDRGELLDDGTQEYAWDAAGRLVGVSGPGGLEVAYSYDGANDRVAVIVDGVTTTYAVDPFSPVDNVSQVLAEETGGAETRYFYGLDLLAQQQGVTLTYLGYDALSVRLHLDGDGNIAAHYQYAPFGEVRGASPAGYGFTGERWDAPVGLLYLRARYYAPGVGRFVSRDPLEGNPWQPGTSQRFLYAANRPVNLTDPSGMRAIVPWDAYFQPGPYCVVDFTEDNPNRLGLYTHIAANFELNPPDVQRYETLNRGVT
jgi:RHS repeat-associated protein